MVPDGTAREAGRLRLRRETGKPGNDSHSTGYISLVQAEQWRVGVGGGDQTSPLAAARLRDLVRDTRRRACLLPTARIAMVPVAAIF